ncbi:MAG: cytochrome P450 [Gammaproteobacteria bacterium]
MPDYSAVGRSIEPLKVRFYNAALRGRSRQDNATVGMLPVSSVTAVAPGPDAPCDLDRLDDKLDRMRALWLRYGDVYRVAAVSRDADTYVINHPDWVRRVLVSNHRNYTKGVGIERVRLLLGNGLMASEGELWRRQRRLLQPGFHTAGIAGFFDSHFRQAASLARRWCAAARSGDPVNVTAAASEVTLRAVLEALLSEDLARIIDQQGRNPFALVSDESRRDLDFAVKFRALGRLIQSIADERRRQRRYPPDLLSRCLQARHRDSGAAMAERQLIDEVLTLIVAGHETTAASLSWLWHLLAAHPEVYARVSAEARALALDAPPDWEQLDRLVWIPRVIKEALRLYPPGWLYTRRAIAADRLGECSVPAGADVFICSYLLHRHPGYWTEPEAFRPERFAADQEARRHPCVYIPFSAGPRRCIGERFAMSEMMIHLAVTAARVSPRPVAPRDVEVEAEVNLRPRQPVFLRFDPLG